MHRSKVNEKLLAFASIFYHRNEIVVKSPKELGRREKMSFWVDWHNVEWNQWKENICITVKLCIFLLFSRISLLSRQLLIVTSEEKQSQIDLTSVHAEICILHALTGFLCALWNLLSSWTILLCRRKKKIWTKTYLHDLST